MTCLDPASGFLLKHHFSPASILSFHSSSPVLVGTLFIKFLKCISGFWTGHLSYSSATYLYCKNTNSHCFFLLAKGLVWVAPMAIIINLRKWTLKFSTICLLYNFNSLLSLPSQNLPYPVSSYPPNYSTF